jgi:uncharacterized protein YndB with AHSA1/START domain
MEAAEKTTITIEALVNAPVEKVWKYWTEPKHITQWAFASDEWSAPKATNDVKVGGKFSTTMAAKDGSMSFDFGGVYTAVELNKLIAYNMDDARKAKITFASEGGKTRIVESFEAEGENSVEMQRGGWQAILDNFRKHVEND